MRTPPAFLQERVEVRTFAGETGRGPRTNDPVNRRVAVEYKRREIPRGNGENVVSEATLTVSPSDKAVFTIGSEVTLPDGRESKVIEVRRRAHLGRTIELKVLCT